MKPPETILRDSPAETEGRLKELRLSTEVLVDAVRTGELERLSCTDLDPASAAGFEAWRWAVRRLRELLVPRGWRAVNDRNLPLVVEPSLSIAVAVTSGDDSTGTLFPPTTLHPKGPATETYIEVNRRQLLLFPAQPSFVPTPSRSERVTWLLLVRPRKDSVRVELSLPASIDEFGYIQSWRERLILAPFRMDDPRSTPGEAPPVDVQIVPKR